MVDKSEKFNWLVRIGYFSRAVLYFTLGLIALTSAARIAQGTDGIFQAIRGFPLGTVLLWVMVVGLFAYALFRLASLVFDIENNGSDTRGWVHRIGHGASGIAHLALAYAAFKFATTPAAPARDGAQQAASTLLSYEFGGVVLGLIGIAFLGAAFSQAKKGITGSFMNRISAQAPDATRWLGAAGYLARAVVYVVIGWSLIRAGFLISTAEQVKTLGDAVASLADDGIVFTLTALGLMLFGLFSLVLARYRIIPEMDVDGRIPKFRAGR